MKCLSRDLHAHALIGAGEGVLRSGRRAAEDQNCGANDENFGQVVERSVMVSHSGSQAQT